MKHLLEVCLASLVLAVSTCAAQSTAEVPKQQGITVNLPTTSNAVAVPDAAKGDALVVTVTHDGSVYLGVNLTSTSALAGKIKDALSNRSEKILYIKADAGTPYANLVRILDSARTAGVQGLTLLTAQRDGENRGALQPPKGLEMLIVSPR